MSLAEAGSQLICPRCYRPVQRTDDTCSGCGAAAHKMPWVTDPLIGRVIDGKYKIDARLGAGGMGAVYLARHTYGDTDLGQVVVKFLLREHVQDQDRRDRFLREAQAARGLLSPHVVKVFDFGEDAEGTPYLVMEFLEGESLFYLLARVRLLPVRRALRIGLQVAEAMVECHAKGILHRDLKPDNLLLLSARAGDFVKIVDFGIARVPAPPTAGPQSISMVSSLVIGTPRYMAPEQILGQPIDARIDLFALGVILYEMMCGQPPILLKNGENDMAFVARNITDAPRRLSDVLVGVPGELDLLVDRMMAKEPGQRPGSMSEVMMALEQLVKLPMLQTDPRRPAPRSEQAPQPAVMLGSGAVQMGPGQGIPVAMPGGGIMMAMPLLAMAPQSSVAKTRPSGLKAVLSRRRSLFGSRSLMAALIGAVVALALLVAWLLESAQRLEQEQESVPPPPHRAAPQRDPRAAPQPARAVRIGSAGQDAGAQVGSPDAAGPAAAAAEQAPPEEPRQHHRPPRHHRKRAGADESPAAEPEEAAAPDATPEPPY